MTNGPRAPALAAVEEQFPCFRIWREETCDRARYVSRSLHPGLNPHTVMTDALGELRADTHDALAVQIRAQEALRTRRTAAG